MWGDGHAATVVGRVEWPCPVSTLPGVDTIIHVGAHKTGTSLIQNALKEGDDLLRREGVRFSSRFDPVWQRHDITECVKAVIAERVGDAERDAFAAFVDELRSEADRAVIVSAEGLLGRPLPAGRGQGTGLPLYATAAASASLLSAAEPTRIVLYIRSQAGFVESMYRQRIKRGRRFTFEEWMAWIPPVGLSWAPVVEAFEAEMGEGIVSVKWFRLPTIGAAAHVEEFLVDACGLDVPFDIPDVSTGKSNISYSDVAMEMARRTSDLLEGRDERMFRQFLREHLSTATHPSSPLLSDDERSRITERYTAENRSILEDHGTPLERSRGVS